MIGIEYLEKVKEMAQKMKMNGRRKSSADIPIEKNEKRHKNYLE